MVQCQGPRSTEIEAQGKRSAIAFYEWLRTEAGQGRIAIVERARLARRKERESEIQTRIEMETTIAALRKLRQKALQFDALKDKVLAELQSGSSCSEVNMDSRAAKQFERRPM